MINFNTRSNTNYMIIHCSATKPDMDVGVREIRQWHRARGFADIGYHKVIRRDGTIEDGRGLNQVGAHCKGYNTESVGVCLVGGVNDDMEPEANFTPEQMASLKGVLAELQEMYPDAKIKGHHDFDNGKACPSFAVQEWLNTGKLVTSNEG